MVLQKRCLRFFAQADSNRVGNTVIELFTVHDRNSLPKTVSQGQTVPAVIAGAAQPGNLVHINYHGTSPFLG
jgi:hypothetical protein